MDLENLIQKIRAIDPAVDTSKVGPVDVLYAFRLLLGRIPDDAGWAFWNSGFADELSVERAVHIMLESEEGHHRWRPAPVLTQANRGFSLYVNPADTAVSRAIQMNGDYEPNVSSFVTRELSGKAGTFVDIGSNIGWYLMLAHAVAPDMRLVGFEPNPANVQISLRSLQRLGLDEQARVYPFALSDSNQMVGLHSVGSNGALVAPANSVPIVSSVRGDEFLVNQDRICLIKMDVEGHEPRTLVGLRRTLQEHRPTLITEFHPPSLARGNVSGTQYLEQLLQLGLSLSVLDRDETGTEVPCRSSSEVLRELDRQDREFGVGDGGLHLDIVARF